MLSQNGCETTPKALESRYVLLKVSFISPPPVNADATVPVLVRAGIH